MTVQNLFSSDLRQGGVELDQAIGSGGCRAAARKVNGSARSPPPPRPRGLRRHRERSPALPAQCEQVVEVAADLCRGGGVVMRRQGQTGNVGQ